MIRIQILGLFYIWKLVNRIRRSIISTGTSAKTKAAFPYPSQLKRKSTQRYDRSYRIVIQMETYLGPNKSLLLWFLQSDTGTSSLQRFSHFQVNYKKWLLWRFFDCLDLIFANIISNLNNEKIYNILYPTYNKIMSLCVLKTLNIAKNLKIDPFCGFDRIVKSDIQ